MYGPSFQQPIQHRRVAGAGSGNESSFDPPEGARTALLVGSVIATSLGFILLYQAARPHQV